MPSTCGRNLRYTFVVRRELAFAFLVSAPSIFAFGACGGSKDAAKPAPPDADASDPVNRPRLDASIHPEAGCPVTIDSPPLLLGQHVPIGTNVVYDSNPPSSGSHYPVWAAFQSFTAPVDRRYYVHDLEHGAIVFLYKCDKPTGCPDIAAELQKAADALPDDPICDKANGVRVRAVITPDPLLDVPVAAASWGWTYKAQCVDLPTLKQFALAHYGQGTETVCANGQTQF